MSQQPRELPGCHLKPAPCTEGRETLRREGDPSGWEVTGLANPVTNQRRLLSASCEPRPSSLRPRLLPGPSFPFLLVPPSLPAPPSNPVCRRSAALGARQAGKLSAVKMAAESKKLKLLLRPRGAVGGLGAGKGRDWRSRGPERGGRRPAALQGWGRGVRGAGPSPGPGSAGCGVRTAPGGRGRRQRRAAGGQRRNAAAAAAGPGRACSGRGGAGLPGRAGPRGPLAATWRRRARRARRCVLRGPGAGQRGRSGGPGGSRGPPSALRARARTRGGRAGEGRTGRTACGAQRTGGRAGGRGAPGTMPVDGPLPAGAARRGRKEPRLSAPSGQGLPQTRALHMAGPGARTGAARGRRRGAGGAGPVQLMPSSWWRRVRRSPSRVAFSLRRRRGLRAVTCRRGFWTR